MASKQKLINCLMDAVKQCQIKYGGRQNLASGQDSTVCCLCQQLENVIQHGLKQRNQQQQQQQATGTIKQMCEAMSSSLNFPVFEKQNTAVVFWHFVRELLSWHEQQRFLLLNCVRSDLGRGRAWLRSALNESALEKYAQMMTNNSELIAKFYNSDALLADPELSAMLPNIVAGLDTVIFAINIDNPDLDHAPRSHLPVSAPVSADPVCSAAVTASDSGRVSGGTASRPLAVIACRRAVAIRSSRVGGGGVSGLNASLSQSTERRRHVRRTRIAACSVDALSPANASPTDSDQSGRSAVFDSFSDTGIGVTTASDTGTGVTTSSDTGTGVTTSSDTGTGTGDTGVIGSYTSTGTGDTGVIGSYTSTGTGVTTASDTGTGTGGTGVIGSYTGNGAGGTGAIGSCTSTGTGVTTASDTGTGGTGAAGTSTGTDDRFTVVNVGTGTVASSGSSGTFIGASGTDIGTSGAGTTVSDKCDGELEQRRLDSVVSDGDLPACSGSGVALASIYTHRTALVAPSSGTDLTTHPRLLGDAIIDRCSADQSSTVSFSPLDGAKCDYDLGECSIATSSSSSSSSSCSLALSSLSLNVDPPVNASSAASATLSQPTDTMSSALSKPPDTPYATFSRPTDTISTAPSQPTDSVSATLSQSPNSASASSTRASTNFSSLNEAELRRELEAAYAEKLSLSNQLHSLSQQLTRARQLNSETSTSQEGTEAVLEAKLVRAENERLALLSENANLKRQLKRYVTAVRVLNSVGARRGPCRSPGACSANGTCDTGDRCCTSSESSESVQELSPGIFQEKLIQMAEIHSEVISFNERLQRQLLRRRARMKLLRVQLRSLGRDVDTSDADEGDGGVSAAGDAVPTGPEDDGVKVWVPSVFLSSASSGRAHHVYQVYIRIGSDEWNVYHRYSRFRQLYRRLRQMSRQLKSFRFPPKQAINRTDFELAEVRRHHLQRFLRLVLLHLLSSHLQLATAPSRSLLVEVEPFFGTSSTLPPDFEQCRSINN